MGARAQGASSPGLRNLLARARVGGTSGSGPPRLRSFLPFSVSVLVAVLCVPASGRAWIGCLMVVSFF